MWFPFFMVHSTDAPIPEGGWDAMEDFLQSHNWPYQMCDMAGWRVNGYLVGG